MGVKRLFLRKSCDVGFPKKNFSHPYCCLEDVLIVLGLFVLSFWFLGVLAFPVHLPELYFVKFVRLM